MTAVAFQSSSLSSYASDGLIDIRRALDAKMFANSPGAPFGVHLFPCLVRLRSSHLPFSADSHRPNLYRFAVNRGWFAAGVSQCERNSASSTALCVCVRQQHKQGGANATVARIHAGIGAGGAQPRPRVPLPTCPLDRPPL